MGQDGHVRTCLRKDCVVMLSRREEIFTVISRVGINILSILKMQKVRF